jgi:signal peptidase II
MKRVPIHRFVLFVAIAAAGLAGDLYSKSAVFADLGYPGGGAPLVRGEHVRFAHPLGFEGESKPFLEGWMTFRLFTSFNQGALWGVGQGYTWLFSTLSLAAAVGIVYWLFVRGAAASAWLTASLAFVMAGTMGNLYDRLGLHGYVDRNGTTILAVRDFLLFTFGDFHWPVFNFADSFLVTGAIMLVLHSLMSTEAPREARGVAASEEAIPAAVGTAKGRENAVNR